MSARFQGRRRQAELLTADLARWARGRDDVDAVVLVGSYARGTARMASDVDLVILSPHAAELADDPSWFAQLRPGSTLVRAQAWGPLLERRYRLHSGLHVELGLVAPTWAASPLDRGTRRVLGDGHVVLDDPPWAAVRRQRGRGQEGLVTGRTTSSCHRRHGLGPRLPRCRVRATSCS